MAPDLAVPALADAAVHVGFEGRVNVRGLHAELHEVAGDGLDAAGGGADDRRGVSPVEAEAGQQVVDVADVRIHLIRRLGERVVHLDAGDFRPFAQVVLEQQPVIGRSARHNGDAPEVRLVFDGPDQRCAHGRMAVVTLPTFLT